MPPRKVGTPGSYNLSEGLPKSKKKISKLSKGKKLAGKKKKGRPTSFGKKGSKRKGNYRSTYSKEDLEAAYCRVTEEGWTAARAAREYGVPRITLMDRLSGRHKTGQIGRPTALSQCEEQVLVDLLILMGEFNYPVSKRHLRDMVKGYLDKRRETRHGFVIIIIIFLTSTKDCCRHNPVDAYQNLL
jgi:hypothetical protein